MDTKNHLRMKSVSQLVSTRKTIEKLAQEKQMSVFQTINGLKANNQTKNIDHMVMRAETRTFLLFSQMEWQARSLEGLTQVGKANDQAWLETPSILKRRSFSTWCQVSTIESLICTVNTTQRVESTNISTSELLSKALRISRASNSEKIAL